MIKKHEIVAVKDGYVVIDKEADVQGGDWFYRTSGSDSWVNGIQQAKKGEFVDGYPKVIASIGIKIEGVPLIELTDEVEQLAKEWCDDAREEGAFIAGYKTNTKQYSEDDMFKIFKEGRFCGQDESEDKLRGEFNFIIKSLQKVPISVCLLMENGVPLQQDGVIKPVKINYE